MQTSLWCQSLALHVPTIHPDSFSMAFVRYKNIAICSLEKKLSKHNLLRNGISLKNKLEVYKCDEEDRRRIAIAPLVVNSQQHRAITHFSQYFTSVMKIPKLMCKQSNYHKLNDMQGTWGFWRLSTVPHIALFLI